MVCKFYQLTTIYPWGRSYHTIHDSKNIFIIQQTLHSNSKSDEMYNSSKLKNLGEKVGEENMENELSN